MKRPLYSAGLILAVTCSGLAHAADSDIRLSSIGYLPDRAKRASIVGNATTFRVVRDSDNAEVFTGTVSAAVDLTLETGESVRTADFSAVTTPGTYHVEVAGIGRSVSFPIGQDIYREAFVTSMLSYYGLRCGTAVSFQYGGVTFGYPACHMDDAHLDYIGGSGTRDGRGGWHDAGDYGKYTVNSGFTLGMLLAAWEEYRNVLEPIALQIPERGGALPDYLDEIKWQLDWLLKMQYSATDGRVSHKITSPQHAAFVMPQEDVANPPTNTHTRYFVPYGTAATADYVAALAKASRVYRPYDAAFADRCLAAARVSYEYLRANTANVAANQTGFTATGTYTTTDEDDRYWAAVEMWETTGEAAALADAETRANNLSDTTQNPKVPADFDWTNVRNLGTYVYLQSTRSGRNATLVSSLRQRIINAANSLVTNRNANPYGRALTSYYWGVNGSVARTCMLLQVANRLAPNTAYLDTCSDQLAYLFGRNTYNRSQVTGLGINPPLHPHHRPSAADQIDAPYPGLLVGGGFPYSAQAGPPAIPACTRPAGACWVDDEPNYMVNENAINWNAALVYALASFLSPAQQQPQDAGVDAPIDAPVDAGAGGTGGATGGAGGATGGAGGATGGAGGATGGAGGATGGTGGNPDGGVAQDAAATGGTGGSTGGAGGTTGGAGGTTGGAGGTTGGAGGTTRVEPAGCGCATGGPSGAASTSLALGLFLLVTIARRRRRD